MRHSGSVAGLAALLIAVGGALIGFAVEAGEFPRTVESLKKRYVDEVHAHQKYAAYAEKAVDDNYPNIAHLFKALGSSEAIHARNFKRLLAELGVSEKDMPDTRLAGFKVGSTKQNLRDATAVEADEIDNEYPSILADIEPEGHREAIDTVTWAWKAEQQHRELMLKIQRAAKRWFGMLAAHIEAKSLRYYVCQVCGSTLTKMPEEQCPICGHPHTEYREVAGYPGPPREERPEH